MWVFIFDEIKRKAKNVGEILRKLSLDVIPNFANGLEADIRKGFRKLFSAKGDCTLKEMDTNCERS